MRAARVISAPSASTVACRTAGGNERQVGLASIPVRDTLASPRADWVATYRRQLPFSHATRATSIAAAGRGGRTCDDGGLRLAGEVAIILEQQRHAQVHRRAGAADGREDALE